MTAMPVTAASLGLPSIDPINLGGQLVNVEQWLTEPFEDISHASQCLPTLLDWVAQTLHSMTTDKFFAEKDIEYRESLIFMQVRAGTSPLIGQHGVEGTKMTAETVKFLVNLDPELVELRRNHAVLAGWCQRLYGLQDAVKHKMDLVRSSESTRRALVDGSSMH